MITLKCRKCDASLERVGGRLRDASCQTGGYLCTEDSGKHVSQRLLQVSVNAKVSVDADAWTLAYGTDPEDIPVDVRDYVLERMQGMITDELMVRDVAVKGA